MGLGLRGRLGLGDTLEQGGMGLGGRELGGACMELACNGRELACMEPELACMEPELACMEPGLACMEPELACMEPGLACMELGLACMEPGLACMLECLGMWPLPHTSHQQRNRQVRPYSSQSGHGHQEG